MTRTVRFVLISMLLLLPSLAVSAQTPGADTGEPVAFAKGMNQPATFFDDRGNPIMELRVTGMEVDWQDYDEYSAPDRGMIYVKVDMEFTNISNRVEIITPYTMSLIDSTGIAQGMAYLYETEGIMLEDTPIAAGEVLEGSVVFAIYDDLDPTLLMWQPDYTAFVFVYLGD